jgi:type VI secretion system protein ImpK
MTNTKEERADDWREEDEDQPSRKPPPRRRKRAENLALLYQGLLTGILRVHSGRQQVMDPETFRRRTKRSLTEIARDSAKLDYANEDVTEAHFAVVAFLDEAVLTSNDPSRTQWARGSLQEELFGQAHAGEEFFKRLEELRTRRDSPQLADILEVYLLCLLLGYEGRYAGGSKAELRFLVEELRKRIDRIRRPSPRFSPQALLPNEPVPTRGPSLLLKKLRLVAAVSALLAIFSFSAFKLHLVGKAEDFIVRVQIGQILH